MTGISWGSVLTCITAGVDYRFAAFAPVYGSGFLLETPGVLNRDYFTMPEDPVEWMQYYDPNSYLQYCNRPIQFTIGTNDSFFSPLLQGLSAGLCQGTVYNCYRWELRHYHRWKDEEGMIHIAKFMDYALSGLTPPFLVEEQSLEDRMLNIKLTETSEVRQIRLVYTDSTEGVSTSWKWSFQLLSVLDFKDNTLHIEVPESAKLCFVEFSDNAFNEYCASSALYRFQ